MTVNVHLDRNVLAEFCREWQMGEVSIFSSVMRDGFCAKSDPDLPASLGLGAPLGTDRLANSQGDRRGSLAPV
jgi:hypothetical protein